MMYHGIIELLPVICTVHLVCTALVQVQVILGFSDAKGFCAQR